MREGSTASHRDAYCEGGLDPVLGQAVLGAELLLQLWEIPHLQRSGKRAARSSQQEADLLTVSSLMAEKSGCFLC